MDIKSLQPAEVWRFFYEITQIPHGSGNLKQIGNYLETFARERSLPVRRDTYGNILISKDGTAGYEDHPVVILQGHMDMVAVKDPGVAKDLLTEGLDVETDGEEVWARGTSLGGDDGIAVAYCLAILDANNIPHPPLEILITTDEETGMDGARGVDLSETRGQCLINIDNEKEGVLLTSCAGGARFHASIPAPRRLPAGTGEGVPAEVRTEYVLTIDGLLGGHSGEMIIKGRANACVLMGRVLRRLSEELEEGFLVRSLTGGAADNAIPVSCSARVTLTEAAMVPAEEMIRVLQEELRGEYGVQDPGLSVSLSRVEVAEEKTAEPLTAAALSRIAHYLTVMPNGVQAMSALVPNLVETSLNLGILRLTEEGDRLEADYSVRSSRDSAKEELLTRLRLMTERFEGSYDISGVYPGWAYREESPLRDTMKRVYTELYGQEPQMVAIHAGVECGLLSAKRPGLDCISIGPDMRDIHTTGEHLSVASSRRTWEYLLAVLAAL
ncbi:MAG: aminoacyl-histidine dipeptidase [Butyrivibrio sp.]|nr:aminoacyl-histidine dipeptidase [Butyrivibrio sp.]